MPLIFLSSFSIHQTPHASHAEFLEFLNFALPWAYTLNPKPWFLSGPRRVRLPAGGDSTPIHTAWIRADPDPDPTHIARIRAGNSVSQHASWGAGGRVTSSGSRGELGRSWRRQPGRQRGGPLPTVNLPPPAGRPSHAQGVSPPAFLLYRGLLKGAFPPACLPTRVRERCLSLPLPLMFLTLRPLTHLLLGARPACPC